MIFAFEDASLARVQCKWAQRQGDIVCVRSYSCRRAAEGFRVRGYTAEEIDAIAAYCPQNRRCYYIPVAILEGRRVTHLRLAPARNNQADGIHWASEYELGAIAQLGERLAGSQKAGGSSPPGSTS
jgi:hypothetical protein